MKSMILALPIAALAFASPVAAQYQGPGGKASSQRGYAQTTVDAIIKAPQDDRKVRLEGRLLRQVADERYLFSDGTGEIVVEIDDEDFPSGAVNENTIVIIEGEVDTHRYKDTDIDADRVTIRK